MKYTCSKETVQQNGYFTLFSSKFHSNIYSIFYGVNPPAILQTFNILYCIHVHCTYNLWPFTWNVYFELLFRLKRTRNIMPKKILLVSTRLTLFLNRELPDSQWYPLNLCQGKTCWDLIVFLKMYFKKTVVYWACNTFK